MLPGTSAGFLPRFSTPAARGAAKLLVQSLLRGMPDAARSAFRGKKMAIFEYIEFGERNGKK
jgi:hypothetical protein